MVMPALTDTMQDLTW